MVNITYQEHNISDLLNHFKFSAVSQRIKKPKVNVSYYKIRWLSLNECVQRLVHLHGTLHEYFEREAMIQPTARLFVQSLKERLLYLFFLRRLLSEINVQCQRSNGLIFESYSKIQTLIATYLWQLRVSFLLRKYS